MKFILFPYQKNQETHPHTRQSSGRKKQSKADPNSVDGGESFKAPNLVLGQEKKGKIQASSPVFLKGKGVGSLGAFGCRGEEKKSRCAG
ncbi:hypothetical protein SLE2022_117160 [Rubroshorea leprosula]